MKMIIQHDELSNDYIIVITQGQGENLIKSMKSAAFKGKMSGINQIFCDCFPLAIRK